MNLINFAVRFRNLGLVFMLPKGIVRHQTEGDCPFIVLSQTTKGQGWTSEQQSR